MAVNVEAEIYRPQDVQVTISITTSVSSLTTIMQAIDQSGMAKENPLYQLREVIRSVVERQSRYISKTFEYPLSNAAPEE